MAIQTSYSDLRQHLAAYFDRAIDDREEIIVRRRSGERLSIIATDELESLRETAYLSRSPANAAWIQEAIREIESGEGLVVDDIETWIAEVEARLPPSE